MRALAAALFGLTAAFLAAGIAVNPAIAQDKAPSVKMKVLVDDDKVKVYEATYAPGAENKGVAASSLRIVRALTSGTLELTYADGKKEKRPWKAGQSGRSSRPGLHDEEHQQERAEALCRPAEVMLRWPLARTWMLAAALAAAGPLRAADPAEAIRLYALDCGYATAKDGGFLSDTGEYEASPSRSPCRAF